MNALHRTFDVICLANLDLELGHIVVYVQLTQRMSMYSIHL
jgi:hypothetical protein